MFRYNNYSATYNKTSKVKILYYFPKSDIECVYKLHILLNDTRIIF